MGSAAFFSRSACRRSVYVHRASLARAVAPEHVSLRWTVHGADQDAQRGARAAADGTRCCSARLRDPRRQAAVRLSVQPELCRLGLPGLPLASMADLPTVTISAAGSAHRATGGLSGRRAVSGLRRGDRAVLLILIPQNPVAAELGDERRGSRYAGPRPVHRL